MNCQINIQRKYANSQLLQNYAKLSMIVKIR